MILRIKQVYLKSQDRCKESIQEILDMIGTSKKIIVHDLLGNAFEVGGTSLRLRTFKEDGIICKGCGKTAEYWGITPNNTNGKANQTYHINLYGMFNLLFTHDHIIPKSKGGADHLSNTQTMCTVCNGVKGSKMPSEVTGYPEHRFPKVRVVFNNLLAQWQVKHYKTNSRRECINCSSLDEAETLALTLTPKPIVQDKGNAPDSRIKVQV